MNDGIFNHPVLQKIAQSHELVPVDNLGDVSGFFQVLPVEVLNGFL